MPHPRRLTSALTTGSLLALSPAAAPQQPAAAEPDHAQRPGWTLVWSDEFDAEAGAPPDPTKWIHDLGGHGWGNNEPQTYTDRTENAAHDGDGHLVITARRENFTGHDGIDAEYTSARLKTQGTFSTQYGRVEARIQLPIGQGIWPAFWMLGDSIADIGWPACGEIDIMEYLGHVHGRTTSALHGPGYSGGDALSSHFDLPDGQRFTDGFHVFAIEWSKDAIHWEVDGTRYHTRTPDDAAPKRWAFDTPMFILLNVATGGDWPRYPDETTQFPQRMRIDYVRVYRAENGDS